jgi:hypothetical protein
MLPTELAEVWQGCGEDIGAVKLCVRWNVLCGKLEGPRLSNGRQSDNRSPFNEEELPAGGLYLADLGFFSLERWRHLARRRKGGKRFFVMRLQYGTGLYTRSGHQIELRGILPRQEGEAREMGVLLGKQAQLPVRLSLPEAMVLLRLRWQIELLFRLWKEHGQIDEWRSKHPWRNLCELYGKLCAMLIQQWLIQAGCWHDPWRSVVKAAAVVRREANRIMVALYEGGLEQVLRSMRSGCRIERRNTHPSTVQLLLEGLDWHLSLTSCLWGQQGDHSRAYAVRRPQGSPLLCYEASCQARP